MSESFDLGLNFMNADLDILRKLKGYHISEIILLFENKVNKTQINLLFLYSPSNWNLTLIIENIEM